MKKIIVTGVTGQVGSYMTDFLLKNTDFEIYGAIRRLSVPNHENIAHIKSERFHLIGMDLSDEHSISSAIEEIKPDYFINFAEAIRKYCPKCRYYNAGSSEEFGDVQYSPQDMNHPPRARSPYGASKVAARQIVKVWRDSYDLYAVQGLLFNHESERRGEEFVTRKITKGVARIKREIEAGDIPTSIKLGNLKACRDWSHAEDFVRGVWLMLNQDRAFYRPAEVDLLLGDPSEIIEELGWERLINFESLVERMVEHDIKLLDK
jgi:GDPmannose 4,6-dehydratase